MRLKQHDQNFQVQYNAAKSAQLFLQQKLKYNFLICNKKQKFFYMKPPSEKSFAKFRIGFDKLAVDIHFCTVLNCAEFDCSTDMQYQYLN